MSIYAESTDSFTARVRFASKSVAEPPWSATPVNAEEHQDSESGGSPLDCKRRELNR